jgi:lipopolysaccharide transport system permease protein
MRNFQAHYSSSVLGISWAVLNPLAMIVIYTLVFSKMMKNHLDGVQSPFSYSIFLMAGILPWGLFADILVRSPSLFIDNANLIKKVSLPKLCFPLISLGNSLLNFAIIYSLFLTVLVIIGGFPNWIFLAVAPVIFLQIILAFGISILLAVLNVFFRDVGQLTSVFVQFWFWLTPIVYSFQVIPERLHFIWKCNPMLSIIIAYQDIFVGHKMPDWLSLMPTMLVALIVNILALHLLENHGSEIVDEL